MTIKKFEVGKTYVDSEQLIEIIVTKRTAKNIFFKFTKPNWFEKDVEKEHRRKVVAWLGHIESFLVENHHAAPLITADEVA